MVLYANDLALQYEGRQYLFDQEWLGSRHTVGLYHH